MAKHIINSEVINSEVAVVTETAEIYEISGAEVSVENGTVATVETVSRPRRGQGQGSVYPLTSGKGWGFCIQLTTDKELRKLYGNKLRHLGTGKTFEEAEAKCADAISRKDELLRAKLEKLGYSGTAE